ncbi:MAG TPA: hypothetical protein VGJ15_06305 [Pirellulales bacterium]|jgi:hypothetical protein
MKYKVAWRPSADDELVRLWLAASSETRKRITAATREIERELAFAADTVGESRETPNRRTLFAEPLFVIFDVYPQSGAAVISGVRQYGR